MSYCSWLKCRCCSCLQSSDGVFFSTCRAGAVDGSVSLLLHTCQVAFIYRFWLTVALPDNSTKHMLMFVLCVSGLCCCGLQKLCSIQEPLWLQGHLPAHPCFSQFLSLANSLLAVLLELMRQLGKKDTQVSARGQGSFIFAVIHVGRLAFSGWPRLGSASCQQTPPLTDLPTMSIKPERLIMFLLRTSLCLPEAFSFCLLIALSWFSLGRGRAAT